MRRSTENRIICALIYWFYESHATWPQRVLRVYSFKEYFTFTGRHVWVEHLPFWRTLYRAVGMVFPACKKLWDRGEAKLWPEKEKPDFPNAM